MPTHQLVRHSYSCETPISLSHASITSRDVPPTQLCSQAVNTLNELTLGDAPHHRAFQQWILGYGLTFVAHAIAFERASEVVSGARTRESFVESLSGSGAGNHELLEVICIFRASFTCLHTAMRGAATTWSI